MKLRTLGILIAALAIFAAACGGGEEAAAPATTAAPAAPTATEAPAAPETPDVLVGQSEIGDVLAGPDGRTLYGFTNDVDAISACYGTCADAWPPVIVDVDWLAGPGLDFGIFATTVREDGQLQLVAGQWPLYFFAGDAVPGDITGQGSGDVWFAVNTDGILIEEGVASGDTDEDEAAGDDTTATEAPAAAALVSVANTSLGDALVDADGLTLYGFLNDVDGAPTCADACADAWPPIIVDGDALPEGLDPAVFSVVPRADGTSQLVAGSWPLYLFAGDAAPGDVNGQGSGDVWFVSAPDGSLIGVEDVAGGDETSAAAPVSVANTSLGDALVDADGLTLYGFLNDVDGMPTCADACADAWPPIFVDGDALPEGLDPAVFSVVQRADGTWQLVAGNWPLYLFAGDAAPGDVNGQGSGDVWFVSAPDGSLIGVDGGSDEDGGDDY